MLNIFNWKTKKSTENKDAVTTMKSENEAVFSALASKQADLYDAIEKAMKRELNSLKE